MALEWFDGFEFVPGSTVVDWGYYDSAGGNLDLGSTNPRFSGAQHVQGFGNAAAWVEKNLSGNYTTIFFAVAIGYFAALSGSTILHSFDIKDGTSVQCSVGFRSDGAIVVTALTNGTGTNLATFTSAFLASVWSQFQVKIVINNTTGSVEVRKDGATSATFSASSLNTRNGTANAYANRIRFNSQGSAVGNADDFVIWQDQGAAPTSWIGDCRVTQHMPDEDTAQKDFTAGTTENLNHSISIANAQSRAGNLLIFGTNVGISPTHDGNIFSVELNFQSSFTGHVKVAIYDDTGTAGAFGAPIAVSDEVTNPSSGTVTFTFSTPARVLASGTYFLGIMADATMSLGGSNTAAGKTFAATYPTFPTNPGTLAANAGTVYGISINTPDNYTEVDEATHDSDTSYVYSAVTDALDLYEIEDLAFTPASIVAIATKGYMNKDNTGPRTAAAAIKSGSTTSVGTSQSISTTRQPIPPTFYATDPDTSAAWTAAGVNALQVGPKVVS